MDNPILAANKSALVESLLRAIAASFGDLPHSLNLFQSVIWEGSAGPPARKGHPVIGRSSCRGHDASSRRVRRVNGCLGSQCSDLLRRVFQTSLRVTGVDGRDSIRASTLYQIARLPSSARGGSTIHAALHYWPPPVVGALI